MIVDKSFLRFPHSGTCSSIFDPRTLSFPIANVVVGRPSSLAGHCSSRIHPASPSVEGACRVGSRSTGPPRAAPLASSSIQPVQLGLCSRTVGITCLLYLASSRIVKTKTQGGGLAQYFSHLQRRRTRHPTRTVLVNSIEYPELKVPRTANCRLA